jgi:beta-lactamase regulating signal transducer with metallopeptidase domain
MTLFSAVPASSSLLVELANPAARALALAGAAGLGLVAFRVKNTAARLFAWTTVLYAALAMPLLGRLLPPLPVPLPAFVNDATKNLQGSQVFGGSVQQSSPLSVPERRQNQAQGASRGGNVDAVQPRRGEGLALDYSPRPASTEALAPSSPAHKVPPTEGPLVATARAPSLPILSSIPWNAIVAAIYLAMASLLLLRFFVGLAFGRRLVHASQIINAPRVTQRLASRARASALASTPPAAESDLISVPVTLGALRATILLPTSWREWDDAKLDAVLAHEVSHVARRDALTQRLSLLHRAIFWFSPLAWWLDRQLADLAEQASDEAALSCGTDRKDYARILLGFFEALHAAPGRVWWQGVSMAKAGQAEQRVERILSWKGCVAMHLKKSIAVVVIALAVPVVYLAASAHPAAPAAAPQHLPIAQSQTPPPASAPAAASEATPPPEPDPQAEPDPAPAATTESSGGVMPATSLRPLVPMAPVSPITPPATGRTVYPPDAATAPLAPVPPARRRAQSSGTGSSHGGFSYHYGYDDEQRFVIVSGKTDSLTMSGDMNDAHHVEKLRKQIQGDFIWFQRDEKSYIIRDQATIDRARKFWAPEEELGKKQEALGKQQEALGKQQEELGAKMEQVQVKVPDMTGQLDKLKAELKALTSGATMEQVGRIQSEIGELQSKIGEIQSQAGEQQSKLGEQQGALGEKQGKLGEQQGELGRQQAELAQEAAHQMKQLLDEAITKGMAQPEL